MPVAVISDIHGNAVALRAVLSHIADAGIEKIVCLGDVLGYGPQPGESLDLIREHCAWAIMGNHDFAALYEPTNFNPAAEQSAFWTREQLDAEPDTELKTARYDYLGRMRVRLIDHIDGDPTPILAVHASPRRPINEYIFPDDAQDAPEKLEAIFERVERIAMCGHTHVPGVFTDEPDFYPPTELGEDKTYNFLEGEKAVINVGSVGQPRDHDPRASYAVLAPGKVSFHRVDYNVNETAEMIKAIPELHDWLGDRLYEGR